MEGGRGGVGTWAWGSRELGIPISKNKSKFSEVMRQFSTFYVAGVKDMISAPSRRHHLRGERERIVGRGRGTAARLLTSGTV